MGDFTKLNIDDPHLYKTSQINNRHLMLTKKSKSHRIVQTQIPFPEAQKKKK